MYFINVNNKCLDIPVNFNCNETVTYTTYGDYTYLHNLPILTSRWNGPISLSLFTPGSDYYETLKIIAYYRNCVKESALIRNYVSFHFVTPTKHIPKKPKKVILSSKEATEYVADCSMAVPGFHNNIKTYR